MSPRAPLPALNTLAVVLQEPHRLVLRELTLDAPGDADVIVDMEWTGISTGTERLLWSGTMPAFPGFGYPLVPGYEAVGRISGLAPSVVAASADELTETGLAVIRTGRFAGWALTAAGRYAPLLRGHLVTLDAGA